MRSYEDYTAIGTHLFDVNHSLKSFYINGRSVSYKYCLKLRTAILELLHFECEVLMGIYMVLFRIATGRNVSG